MSRNRWEEIKSNLHFNDNSNTPSQSDAERDRLFKIRPLVDALTAQFKELPLEDNMLSVDEQTVPFKGNSHLKQYNPKKPNKWGYKIFVLSDSRGLTHNFEIYTGNMKPPQTMPDIGASGNAVLRLIEKIPRDDNYLLYFDNWYASPRLFVELAKIGIMALGTFRLYRFAGLNFSPDQEMEEKGRGTFEEKTTTIDGVEIRALKWIDNKPVYIATTFDSAAPVSTVERYDKKEKRYVNVPCPHAIHTYNKFMGGVDLIDGLIAYYRIGIRSKKYYLRFFFHFVDMAVVAAWRVYLRDNESQNIPKKSCLNLLAFRFEVAQSLCFQGVDVTKRGRPSTSALSPNNVDNVFEAKKKRGPAKAIPSSNVRRDSTGHWPIITDKRQRCRHKMCNLKSQVKCVKCDIYLCLNKTKNCFVDFHM